MEKNDPEAYLKLLMAHCEMLLELGHQMEHVEQLLVGSWIDRLTIALVRLKRWEEAERRLEDSSHCLIAIGVEPARASLSQ